MLGRLKRLFPWQRDDQDRQEVQKQITRLERRVRRVEHIVAAHRMAWEAEKRRVK